MVQSLVLGVVQGLTEFLPVSSSAHLILVPRLFGWADQGLAFDVALHLGTLAGVLTYFWRDLWAMVVERSKWRLIGLLILATIPAAVVGMKYEHVVETTFRSPHLIAVALILAGAALAAADYFGPGKKTLTEITVPSAIGIGLAQALALIPGVSRSGITITASLATGLTRQEAARFSFLLSIPVIAGAGILKAPAILESPDKVALGVGFAASALSGFFAISVLMKYVQTRRYTPFVMYRFLLGAVIFLFGKSLA